MLFYKGQVTAECIFLRRDITITKAFSVGKDHKYTQHVRFVYYIVVIIIILIFAHQHKAAAGVNIVSKQCVNVCNGASFGFWKETAFPH